jgi:hypothetical protein
MLQSFLSSVTVRLQGRLVPTHSYYYRMGGKRPSPCAANSHYKIEGDWRPVHRRGHEAGMARECRPLRRGCGTAVYDALKGKFSRAGVLPYGLVTSHCGANGTHIFCVLGEPRHGWNSNTEPLVQIAAIEW